MATLARVEFGKEIEDARVELAKEAKAMLGYNRLARAIAMPGALLFQLRELDIAPFATESVNRYMASKEYTGMWSGTKLILRWLAGAGIAAASLAWGLSVNRDLSWGPLHHVSNVVSALSAVVCLIAAFACCMDSDWGHGTQLTRNWKASSISNYSGNIPEFALSRALEIKKAVPTATMDVVFLVEAHQRRDKPLPDPFLRVTLGDESYFIDVWDEKEYEVKM